jgi:hypothetical protein
MSRFDLNRLERINDDEESSLDYTFANEGFSFKLNKSILSNEGLVINRKLHSKSPKRTHKKPEALDRSEELSENANRSFVKIPDPPVSQRVFNDKFKLP